MDGQTYEIPNGYDHEMIGKRGQMALDINYPEPGGALTIRFPIVVEGAGADLIVRRGSVGSYAVYDVPHNGEGRHRK